MLTQYKKKLEKLLTDALEGVYSSKEDMPFIEVDMPIDNSHGEFTTNIAMRSARVLKKSPMDIAQKFLEEINKSLSASDIGDLFDDIQIKAPGFINFYCNPKAIQKVIGMVFSCGDDFGKMDFGQGKKVQVEFVSANPTGPLSVAHARQAVVGDVLVNILNALGFEAHKEYYINDGGNQINILGQSLQLRAEEILGGKIDFPEDCYQGEYIKDMVQIFMDNQGVKDLEALRALDPILFRKFGVDYLLDVIKTDLNDFGVSFDCWSNESKIADEKSIMEVLELLKERGFTYEKEGALWFKSTEFGDDKDRVLKKSDGSFTYLSPDIVYHKDKFERGYSKLFNIWGPDHHGYIPRITAAVEALGYKKEDLKVLIVQLATIYRQGQAVSMSTRKGQYISLREVIDEVGVDAARFFFLMRHIKAHLDFDLELAKKQTPENPVYYIQYAHARVFSINKKAQEAKIKIKTSNFNLLDKDEELDLMKKIGSFSESLKYCYDQSDPYPLISYLQELATCFHKFYDSHKVIGDDVAVSEERLGLVNATRIVLANGLKLLGVSTPEQM